MTHVDGSADCLGDACLFMSACFDAFALEFGLSLSYLKLRNSIFALFSQVLFTANEHLWSSMVDCSCLVCPLRQRILERDAVVEGEAYHEGIEALKLLNHETFKSFKFALLASYINDFQIIQDPLECDLTFVEVKSCHVI